MNPHTFSPSPHEMLTHDRDTRSYPVTLTLSRRMLYRILNDLRCYVGNDAVSVRTALEEVAKQDEKVDEEATRRFGA